MMPRRIVAWILIWMGVIALTAALLSIFGPIPADPKGTGSVFFAAFFLMITGWVVGDF